MIVWRPTVAHPLSEAPVREGDTGQGEQLCAPDRLDVKHTICLAHVRRPHESLLRRRMRGQVPTIVEYQHHLAHLVIESYSWLDTPHGIGMGKIGHKSEPCRTT